MQAIFQIPFGMLSDRYGNKPMMLIGLTQVVAGLILAYFAKNIALLIFARALQGSGAVIGVGYSWAAGPLLRRIISVNWMFMSCAILLFLNELYILFFIKDHKNENSGKQSSPNEEIVKEGESVLGKEDFVHKIHDIVYSSHKYRLSVSLLMEVKQFYQEVWLKIEQLKQFKLNATKKVLEEGVEAGIFKSDIHFGVLSKMLEEISDMFTDYDFLLENRLKATEAMNEALNIIFNGILKD